MQNLKKIRFPGKNLPKLRFKLLSSESIWGHMCTRVYLSGTNSCTNPPEKNNVLYRKYVVKVFACLYVMKLGKKFVERKLHTK